MRFASCRRGRNEEYAHDACIKVIVWDGKETGRLIAERIMEKAEK